MLYCVECGCCSGELGKGWVAFLGEDPDGIDPPCTLVYCPVCAWEPLPAETTDGLL
jgi:hypothetical protein